MALSATRHHIHTHTYTYGVVRSRSRGTRLRPCLRGGSRRRRDGRGRGRVSGAGRLCRVEQRQQTRDGRSLGGQVQGGGGTLLGRVEQGLRAHHDGDDQGACRLCRLARDRGRAGEPGGGAGGGRGRRCDARLDRRSHRRGGRRRAKQGGFPDRGRHAGRRDHALSHDGRAGRRDQAAEGGVRAGGRRHGRRGRLAGRGERRALRGECVCPPGHLLRRRQGQGGDCRARQGCRVVR
mmetsp:Transcript_26014/g.77537  ORF Transcript_26014/g.77537 Transcript_26014/m.77537 type:complete len:236 (+) Transcript_26014:3-710(+)